MTTTATTTITPYGYQMPTRIVFGIGSLSLLPETIRDPQARVMVVSGQSAMRREGVLDRIASMLGEERTVFHEGVPPNPTPEEVDRAVTAFREGRCEAIVGIGGGSALDVAKCVSVLHASPYNTRTYLAKEAPLNNGAVPYVAVPTTAGTGTEVTPWATVWDMQRRQKLSMENTRMFATAAVIDPALATSLSPYQTAVSGMDALTQAVEAYWSRNAQPISDMYALAAVRTIFGNLREACAHGDIGARSAMAQGSLSAGLAFSNTKTTICHSLSYPMTAHFGIPHGQAVSITLPPFLLWNAEAISYKLSPLLEALGADEVDEAAERIRTLMASIGLATDFRSLGLAREDLDLILQEGLCADRADNNPKTVSFDDACSIIQANF